MDRRDMVQVLDEEIARLTEARNLLSGSSTIVKRRRAGATHKAAKPVRKRRMSAEGRARIARATKRRWAAWRKANKRK
jgi:hypothetical protein